MRKDTIKPILIAAGGMFLMLLIVFMCKQKSVSQANYETGNIGEEIYYPQPTEEPFIKELTDEEREALLKEMVDNFLEYSDLVIREEESTTKDTIKKKSNKTSTKVQNGKEVSYSEYKLFSLAKIISAEAGGVYSDSCKKAAEAAGITSDIWQQYVGYVFLNRVESKYFPDSYEEVMKQGYAKETIDKFYKDFCTKEALKNAKICLDNYYSGNCPVSKKLVYQAEFKQGDSIFLKVGNTYFCEMK